ncbi:hypothetical protein OIU77_030191 [Salix suchowensis]|uniref:Uncharacterized protein n=1 Tax=Salix suchowensis TaxID=1278906 RepID=A0ABQ9BB31_9ROSI|nr:hypothetical protein OIU77_030191 [Salix suchowensis]KAJ6381458.1 hypothetical protein OIU77_030191 [Salix suchowensis]
MQTQGIINTRYNFLCRSCVCIIPSNFRMCMLCSVDMFLSLFFSIQGTIHNRWCNFKVYIPC